MATKVQIANGALVKLGGRTISSLAGTEKEAKLCNARFDACRQFVLRAFPWPFAMGRVILDSGDEAAAPAFDFEHAYTLPADFLRVFVVNESDEAHRVEAGTILSDASEIRLRYVTDYDEADFPDPAFNEALSCYLAFDIAYALTQSSEVRNAMWQLYLEAMKQAKHIASTEQSVTVVEAEDFIEARLARGRYVRDPGT